MGQAIERGRLRIGVAEDLRPAAESKIRRHDDRSALVPFREDLEQQFSSFFEKETYPSSRRNTSELDPRSVAWRRCSSRCRAALPRVRLYRFS